MQQCAGFQQYARLRRKMMHRLQLIEKKNAQLPHVLRMLLIVSEPPGETSRPTMSCRGFGVVAVGLLARKSVARDFLQQSFANADAGCRKGGKFKYRPGDERNRRDPITSARSRRTA